MCHQASHFFSETSYSGDIIVRSGTRLPYKVISPHLKLKSCEISFTHNLFLICKIVWKFRTEHISITAVLCAKFQNDSTTEMDVLEERDFARFEFGMRFGRHPISQQSPPEFYIRVLTTAAVPHEHFYVPSPFSLCYTRLAIHGGGSNLGTYGPLCYGPHENIVFRLNLWNTGILQMRDSNLVIVFFNSSYSVPLHCNDVIMGAIASQITSLTIVYSTDYSDADQRKHQSFASLAFVRGIRRGPANSPHKWPVTRKMLPFDDVIMTYMGPILLSVVLYLYRTRIRSSLFLFLQVPVSDTNLVFGILDPSDAGLTLIRDSKVIIIVLNPRRFDPIFTQDSNFAVMLLDSWSSGPIF